MPFKSQAQMRWGNSPAGHKALGNAGVAEWNAATKGKRLPPKVGTAKLHKAAGVPEKPRTLADLA